MATTIQLDPVTRIEGHLAVRTEVTDGRITGAWVNSEVGTRAVLPAAPFLPRYAAEYLQDPELNFTSIRHYLEALEMRRVAHEMAALFLGKIPHAATLVPGGVTEHVTALKIAAFRSHLARLQVFIDTAYLPDVRAVATAFPAYFALGAGCGNVLAYGGVSGGGGRGESLLSVRRAGER